MHPDSRVFQSPAEIRPASNLAWIQRSSKRTDVSISSGDSASFYCASAILASYSRRCFNLQRRFGQLLQPAIAPEAGGNKCLRAPGFLELIWGIYHLRCRCLRLALPRILLAWNVCERQRALHPQQHPLAAIRCRCRPCENKHERVKAAWRGQLEILENDRQRFCRARAAFRFHAPNTIFAERIKAQTVA